MKLEDVQLTPPEVLAIRMIEMAMLLTDLHATKGNAQLAKWSNITVSRESTAAWAKLAGLSQSAGPLKADFGKFSEGNVKGLLATLRPSTVKLRAETRTDMHRLMLLEAWGGTSLPKGHRWAVDRDATFAAAGSALDGSFSLTPAKLMRRRYERTVKRLSSDAVSPSLKLGLLGGPRL